MRVTDLTKQNTVTRNIQAAEQKLQQLQGDISSGKRITKISDDPIGATQAQDFRTRISFMGTLQRNIRNDFVWLDRTEGEIADVTDMLNRTKTLILAQANASGDDATRRVTAEELGALIDGMVSSGNAKIGKLYIFSGSKTFTRPLEENPIRQPAILRLVPPSPEAEEGEELAQKLKRELMQNLVDQVEIELPPEIARDTGVFEGNSSNAYLVRITKSGALGLAHYKVSDDGGETWSRAKALLPKIEVFNEDGKNTDKVMLRVKAPEIPDSDEEFIFPAGLEFEFKPNPFLEYRGNDDRRMVRTGEGVLMPMNVTARDIFFKNPDDPDSVDILDMMAALRRALLDNDQVALESRLEDIDLAFQQVLATRASIGAVRKEMEDRLQNLSDREFSKTVQLSDVEDLDMPEAVVEMNLADTRNRAALDTSARLLQPSLLNFLR